MSLSLCSEHLQLISAQAERTYPEECCGLLLGHFKRQQSQPDKTLVEVWATTNAWSEAAIASVSEMVGQDDPLDRTKTSRYWIDPKEMLIGQRYARDRQLDIIGIYHSHPDHPAIPSECDRALAWSHYVYLIVSVQQGIAQDLLCWSLDENHQFQPEEILLIPSSRS